MINPSEENRSDLNKAEAELKIYLHIEDEYWRQKAGMKWFTDRDKNMKFFHAYVNGKKEGYRLMKYRQGRGMS